MPCANFTARTAGGSATFWRKNGPTGVTVDLDALSATFVDGTLMLVSPYGGPGGALSYPVRASGGRTAEAAQLQFTPPGGAPIYIAVAFAAER